MATEGKQTLDEILAQIADLQAQADQLKQAQKADALAQAKSLIQKYDLTARELGLTTEGGADSSVVKGRRPAAAKFAHPTDPELTWSGRGRKPVWVVQALAEGKTLDDLLISK